MSLHIIKLKYYAYWNDISLSLYITLEKSLQKHLHIRQLGLVLPITVKVISRLFWLLDKLYDVARANQFQGLIVSTGKVVS